MSCHDGFILVKRKGKKQQLIKNNSKQFKIVNYNFPVATLISEVRNAVLEFKNSSYKKVLLDGLFECFQILDLKGIKQIVCYGLGNFSYQKNAKYQLAALVNLKTHFKCESYIFDPLFNDAEKEALELLGFSIIPENEEGKRPVSDKVTLLFAVHCSKQLYNNFIFANWSKNIKNCIIYGNSWEEIICNSLKSDLRKAANYLLRINPFTTEIQLKNNFVHFETFNSSSLHIFPRSKLESVDSKFWLENDEPVYKKHDIEFIENNLS